MLVGYAGIDLFQSLLTTDSNAYTRSSVSDALCDISMAHVATGETGPSALPTLAILASFSNGVLDYNFNSALCWQALLRDEDNPLHGRLMQGIEEVRGSGNPQGVPVMIVHGRSDALIPVNHSSRPYYALNRQIEGSSSGLYYYEISNAQHLDALNPAYTTAGMNQDSLQASVRSRSSACRRRSGRRPTDANAVILTSRVGATTPPMWT